MLVQVVVLDLAEIPVVILQDLQEILRVSVVGKPDIPDDAGFLLLPDPFQDPHLLQPDPLGDVRQHMHQVIVDIVRLKPFQFLPERFFNARHIPHHILGKLGGDVYFFPDPVPLQDCPEQFLAARIDIRGIVVVHARPVSGQDLLLRLVQIQRVPLFRETHASETQHGQFPAGSVLPILQLLHFLFPAMIPHISVAGNKKEVPGCSAASYTGASLTIPRIRMHLSSAFVSSRLYPAMQKPARRSPFFGSRPIGISARALGHARHTAKNGAGRQTGPAPKGED